MVTKMEPKSEEMLLTYRRRKWISEQPPVFEQVFGFAASCRLSIVGRSCCSAKAGSRLCWSLPGSCRMVSAGFCCSLVNADYKCKSRLAKHGHW
ncbi:unnamed protein product [Lathyrus oleraceus]|uniref:uncharacterized protein LOC127129864 isoform X2 n=1 Tax=Pisum sativum TaxID=3888 RepID=UPI0021CE2CB4|nr:uncharacterized protein LOC127129864 isoform X2 [Pisum sativum]